MSIEVKCIEVADHIGDGAVITMWVKADGHDTPHREDGPAIVYANGNEIWMQHGWYHRIGGPAFVNWDGDWGEGSKYYINGKSYTEEEYMFEMFIRGIDC